VSGIYPVKMPRSSFAQFVTGHPAAATPNVLLDDTRARPNPVTTARTVTGTLVPEAGPLTTTSPLLPMPGTRRVLAFSCYRTSPKITSPPLFSSLNTIRKKKIRDRKERR
jgi:hypothetical protein